MSLSQPRFLSVYTSICSFKLSLVGLLAGVMTFTRTIALIEPTILAIRHSLEGPIGHRPE